MFEVWDQIIHAMTIHYVDHAKMFQSEMQNVFRMDIFSEISKTGCRTQVHI